MNSLKKLIILFDMLFIVVRINKKEVFFWYLVGFDFTGVNLVLTLVPIARQQVNGKILVVVAF